MEKKKSEKDKKHYQAMKESKAREKVKEGKSEKENRGKSEKG